MNREWIKFNLQEAVEELQRTIAELDSPQYDAAEYAVAMAHAYHHLNTAWNGREATPTEVEPGSDELFYRWRSFPTDIFLGR